MNNKVRANMVIAMNRVIECLNDEDLLGVWLMNGVADGDISPNTTSDEVDEYYLRDENFAELMALFMRMMRYALNDTDAFSQNDLDNGNELLYCDGIVSKRKE